MFFLELSVEDARAFGVPEAALAPFARRPVLLSTTERGIALSDDHADKAIAGSLPEMLSYSHQIGRQLGFGDRVRAYAAIHRRRSLGGVEAHPSMKRHRHLRDHARLSVSVGDVVRWGKGADVHVGRVKEIAEGGQVGIVRLRGSGARIPVPIYELATVVSASTAAAAAKRR